MLKLLTSPAAVLFKNDWHEYMLEKLSTVVRENEFNQPSSFLLTESDLWIASAKT